MIFVTAAYGAKYRGWARAMVSTFYRYNPSASLSVFADGPVEGAIDVRVNAIDLKGTVQNDGSFEMCLKVSAVAAMAKEYGDDICWIDCDQLVLADLSTILIPGQFNVIGYGAPGERRNCGDGISVAQEDYILSGFFSMPPYVAGLYRGRAQNAVMGGEHPKLREQEFVNRLVVEHGAHRLDKSNPDMILNFAWGGHPTTSDEKFLSLEARPDGTWWMMGRQVGMLCFIAHWLDIHVTQKFAAFTHERTRSELRALYGVAQ